MFALNTNDQSMDNQAKLKERSAFDLNSRFGRVLVDPAKALYFPKGLPGFPEDLHFSLVNFPTMREDLQFFKILQCLNDHSVSFPVVPSSFENVYISPEDMEECLNEVEIKKENFAMLFIATSTKQPDGSFKLFINTKAPIIIDTSLQIAIQYVFTNNKYNTRQPIGINTVN